MDTSTGHIHTSLSDATNDGSKMVSVPAQFASQAYELKHRGCSVFNPHHEFSEFREWALEKSKYHSRDKIDALVKPIKMGNKEDSFTKTPKNIRKIQNRKRNKIAKASKKKNRQR